MKRSLPVCEHSDALVLLTEWNHFEIQTGNELQVLCKVTSFLILEIERISSQLASFSFTTYRNRRGKSVASKQEKLTLQKNKQKSVLVTGGAGFIGSHLCEYYLERAYRVYCMDNLLTGSEKNISTFYANKNFTFIKQDIIEPIDLPVDLILNFACPASPVWYQKDPIHTMRTCFEGTRNMLNLAKKYNARLIQASTSEVYGDPKEHPQSETYWGNVNPVGLRSCYDEGKRIAETLCFDYARAHNIDTSYSYI